ncbi:hypothetical protein OTSUT76_3208 [Orientia tsutsugamushi str. UT76]|nr:hypothetical protein OTSUT76_3208 [Orientia tsutsugamushi str. UT76]
MNKDLYLWKLQLTTIKLRILVKGKSSPDNSNLENICINVKLIALSICLNPGRFFGVDKKINVLFVLI